MDQTKTVKTGQVPYLDRWVDREHFCAFAYNETEQRLAKTYDEFSNLLATGLWFDSREHALEAIAKVSNSTPLAQEEIPIDEIKVRRDKTKNQFKAVNSGK